MKKEEFKKVITNLKTIWDRNSVLNSSNLCMISYNEVWHDTVELLLKNIFNNGQIEWVDWFMYENDFGRKGLEAVDQYGNPICRTIDELWEELQKLC